MASGFSLSEMATGAGCCLKVATGGGAGRGGGSVRATGASWAAATVGVMGDTGGRVGEVDSDCLCERTEEASLDAGRGFVSTSSAGMAAGWASLEALGPSACDGRGRGAQRPGATS